MGGSNKEQGSLSTIERYDFEFDTWTLLSLTLPLPMHDFQSVVLQCDEDACHVLVFGGQTSDERVIKRAHIVDLTLELQRGSSSELTIHKKVGKLLHPLVPIDQRRVYLFAGYSDELLHPFVLDLKALSLDRVRLQKQVVDKVAETLVSKVENIILGRREPPKSEEPRPQSSRQAAAALRYQDADQGGNVYQYEQVKPPLGRIVDKMKNQSEQSSAGFDSYKGYVVKK